MANINKTLAVLSRDVLRIGNKISKLAAVEGRATTKGTRKAGKVGRKPTRAGGRAKKPAKPVE